MPVTVLNRTLGAYSSFPTAIPRYLRARVEQEAQAIGPTSSPNVLQRHRLLNELADLIEDRDPNCPQVFSLYLASPDGDSFVPGDHQQQLLSTAGLQAETPTPEDLLSELVLAAMDDLLARHSKVQERARDQLARAQADAEFRPEAERLRGELADANAELSEARDEVGRLTAQLDTLRALVPNPNAETTTKPAKPTRKRRSPTTKAKAKV